MAGFWTGSYSQINNAKGAPYIGARAYFYSGSTTTPITTYRDNDLSTPHPNPLVTDGNGVFPAVFFDEADQFYRVRVTTKGGVVLFDTPAVPIIGPSGSGGGAPPTPVDPDSVMSTGDMMIRFGNETRVGFVRLNGRTIGSATSGAEERANSDTQPLYSYLWNIWPTAPIAGGRGASAAADFGANKTMVLPDWRGRALVGYDNMGNAAAGIMTGATVVGWSGGSQSHTLTAAQMPSHAHGVDDYGHDHPLPYPMPIYRPGWGDRGSASSMFAIDQFTNTQRTGGSSSNIAIRGAGGGEAHNNVQPSTGCSIYMRL